MYVCMYVCVRVCILANTLMFVHPIQSNPIQSSRTAVPLLCPNRTIAKSYHVSIILYSYIWHTRTFQFQFHYHYSAVRYGIETVYAVRTRGHGTLEGVPDIHDRGGVFVVIKWIIEPEEHRTDLSVRRSRVALDRHRRSFTRLVVRFRFRFVPKEFVVGKVVVEAQHLVIEIVDAVVDAGHVDQFLSQNNALVASGETDVDAAVDVGRDSLLLIP